MKKSVVVIGPSDRTKPSRYGSVTDYEQWIDDTAKLLRKYFELMYFIPDKGTYVDLALSFADEDHEIVAVIPEMSEEYAHWTKRYTTHYQVIEDGGGWTFLNSHIIGLASTVICLGYSAGSILEMCSAKYMAIYNKKIIKIFIDRRAVSAKLPDELHEESIDVCYYQSSDELDELLSHEEY